MVDVEKTPRMAEMHSGSPLYKYLLYRRHLFAYEKALERSSGRGVCLDIACGLGYALPALKNEFDTVLALDMADNALDSLPRDSARLLQADARYIPVRSSSVDVVLAFQIIEHMSQADGIRLIREIQRVLTPGGVGFITTPNARWRLLPGQKPWNPYHVHEYSTADIVRLAEKAGLGKERIYGVVGVNGAQEIERERVRQNPLSVWGGRVGAGINRRLRKVWPERGAGVGSRLSTESDVNAEWYVLSREPGSGLDFWLEVTKD